MNTSLDSLTQLDSKILLLLAPVAIIQVGLMIFCLVKLVRSKGTRYMNKGIWALLIIFINLIGSILYLVLESGHNDSD
jgi:heme/copper-type cytochrome/quinol oxidase subunit 4